MPIVFKSDDDGFQNFIRSVLWNSGNSGDELR